MVFVVSTSGQGDPPYSLLKFWNFIMRRDLESCLNGVQFAVFGLGDSSYAKYCYCSKLLFRRLEMLGATPLIERGDGDDQHPFGYEGSLEPWMTALFQLEAIKKEIKMPFQESLPYKARISDTGKKIEMRVESSGKLQVIRRFGSMAKVIRNDRITSVDCAQETRHIEWQFCDSIQYEAGDVCSLFPANSAEDVNEMLEVLNFSSIADNELEIIVQREDFNKDFTLNYPWTLRDLLSFYFDFQCTPGRYFFEVISRYAQDPIEKEKLLEFSNVSQREGLESYVIRPQRTSLEVLKDFGSVKLELSCLFDIFPSIKPRFFSISQKDFGCNTLSQTVAVKNVKTLMRTPRRGLCSKFLSSLPKGFTWCLDVQKSSFRIPQSTRKLLIVCTGTGIAPVRAMVQQYQQMELFIFFGCKSAQLDFLYKEEWNQHENIKKFINAFSRASPLKRYVQDALRDEKDLVAQLIQDDAVVVISGNSRIYKPVLDALKEICTPEKIEEMERKMMIQSETW